MPDPTARERVTTTLSRCIWGDPSGRKTYEELAAEHVEALTALIDERIAGEHRISDENAVPCAKCGTPDHCARVCPSPSPAVPDREALGRAAFDAWCSAGCPLRPNNDNDHAAWRYIGAKLFAMGRESIESGEPERGSRLWRCELELRNARERISTLEEQLVHLRCDTGETWEDECMRARKERDAALSALSDAEGKLREAESELADVRKQRDGYKQAAARLDGELADQCRVVDVAARNAAVEMRRRAAEVIEAALEGWGTYASRAGPDAKAALVRVIAMLPLSGSPARIDEERTERCKTCGMLKAEHLNDGSDPCAGYEPSTAATERCKTCGDHGELCTGDTGEGRPHRVDSHASCKDGGRRPCPDCKPSEGAKEET